MTIAVQKGTLCENQSGVGDGAAAIPISSVLIANVLENRHNQSQLFWQKIAELLIDNKSCQG